LREWLQYRSNTIKSNQRGRIMTRKRRKAISHILTKGKSKRNKSTNKFINLKKA